LRGGDKVESEVEKYLNNIKSVLDQKRKESFLQLQKKFDELIQNKEKQLEEVKRKALKEVSK
jgi:6-phosphogluconate dehydrogenase